MDGRLEDFNNGKSIIINVRKASKDPLRYLIDSADFVYCGDYVQYTEYKRSAWFNPYHGLVKKGERDKAIELFKNHLLSSPELLAKLPTLKGKVLGCWCYPSPCHCSVLIEEVHRLT